jgi:hypothetical protein
MPSSEKASTAASTPRAGELVLFHLALHHPGGLRPAALMAEE